MRPVFGRHNTVATPEYECSVELQLYEQLFRHWNTRQMQELVSVRRAIFSAKSTSTKYSAFSTASAKVSAKNSDSAGIQRNFLLSAGIQQKFQQKELFSRDSAKFFAVSESSADLFVESQQLAIKALNINYFVSATGRAAILINTTAVLGGLLPKMERGVFETNGFSRFQVLPDLPVLFNFLVKTTKPLSGATPTSNCYCAP